MTQAILIQGRVSPFQAVDQDALAASINARGDKSVDELKTERDDIHARLVKAHDESEGGKDYSKMRAFGGESATANERMHLIVQAHADSAACNRLIAQKESLALAKAQEEGKLGDYATSLAPFLTNAEGGTGMHSAFVLNAGGGVDVSNHLVPLYQAPRTRKSFGSLVIEAMEAGGHKFEKGSPVQKMNLVVPVLDQDLPQIFGATFTASDAGGAPPFVTPEPGYTPHIQRMLQAWNVFRKYRTAQFAIKYYEETTRANQAAVMGQNTRAPESTSIFTEKTVPIHRVGHRIPVTEEALTDVSELSQRLNMVMAKMVMDKAEEQALMGTGDANSQWRGLENAAGILSRNLVGGANPSQFIKDTAYAMGMIMTEGETYPTDIIMAPQAWIDLILEQPAEGGGLYLGNPGSGFMPMIWGLPVALSTAYPYTAGAKTVGVMGNFEMWAAIALLQEVLVEIGTENDDFSNFRYTMRASLRGALKVERPKAFCLLKKTA